jgi:RNA polymerase sigma-70 factor (ECF subfamily)
MQRRYDYAFSNACMRRGIGSAGPARAVSVGAAAGYARRRPPTPPVPGRRTASVALRETVRPQTAAIAVARAFCFLASADMMRSPLIPGRRNVRSGQQINAQRSYLLRVAQLQLRDRDQAEDVVQETLLAALEAQAKFAGKSSVKTWLTGILKHKIIDAIRESRGSRRSRRCSRSPTSTTSTCSSTTRTRITGNEAGRVAKPGARSGAAAVHGNDGLLPGEAAPNTARVFMLREVMELESDEICQELKITATNLWVILYRARMLLRKCLEQNWFGEAAADG